MPTDRVQPGAPLPLKVATVTFAGLTAVQLVFKRFKGGFASALASSVCGSVWGYHELDLKGRIKPIKLEEDNAPDREDELKEQLDAFITATGADRAEAENALAALARPVTPEAFGRLLLSLYLPLFEKRIEESNFEGVDTGDPNASILCQIDGGRLGANVYTRLDLEERVGQALGDGTFATRNVDAIRGHFNQNLASQFLAAYKPDLFIEVADPCGWDQRRDLLHLVPIVRKSQTECDIQADKAVLTFEGTIAWQDHTLALEGDLVLAKLTVKLEIKFATRAGEKPRLSKLQPTLELIK